MAFTDEDLKRLKEAKWRPEESFTGDPLTPYFKIERDLMLALLARLEAAEKVCKQMDECAKQGRLPDYVSALSLIAWRKAAGK